MLERGQPVTAFCGAEYLCIVVEPKGGNRATVDVIAIIERDRNDKDKLTVIDTYRQDWFVTENDDGRAIDLYLLYSKITGTNLSPGYVGRDNEEVWPYTIKGRIV